MAGIELYQHPIGPERGYVHLVINCPDEPELKRLICTSEKSKDFGVVFTIDMDDEEYEAMCEDEGIKTLEGCTMSTYGDQIELIDIPEEPPPPLPEKSKTNDNLRVLTNPNIWKHKWGRCCCVQRGNETTPVTPETIAEGEVPWWNERYTPFQLDLIQAANDPDNKAMHLLVDDDRICGACDHYTWVVAEEDIPDSLPEPPEFVDAEEPLCIDRDALNEIPWKSKSSAWDIFYEDPHNREVIKESKLPIERANQRQKYSHEYTFASINSQSKQNISTVKQAFYFALGAAQKGTWGDFELDTIRSIEGLEDVDIPAEILEQVELDDQEETEALHKASAARYVKKTIDSEADELEDILDEEASLDVPPEFLEEEEIPEVVEPTKQKPPKQNRPSKRFKRRSRLVDATRKLKEAIDVFLTILEEEEDEEEDEERLGT
jgi:hypothetical protein